MQQVVPPYSKYSDISGWFPLTHIGNAITAISVNPISPRNIVPVTVENPWVK
ncbi:hypothetical protein ABZT47_03145 [Sphaerisporangium sp. NPDC005289]|uniref:hypothetical protein n=1 Tax=Sphaerisporangium sp. NPDC005289 TaxID=3155247 RepID=UPI0033A4A78C